MNARVGSSSEVVSASACARSNLLIFAVAVGAALLRAAFDFALRIAAAISGCGLSSSSPVAGGRSGDANALRSQVSIGNVARECQGQPDGSTLVKVGVEGRALLGAGGGAGRFNVPVQIVVKGGSGVIATRSRQTSVAIPSGDTQASFAGIEGGIVVPAAYANTFEMDVGLGGRTAAGRRG